MKEIMSISELVKEGYSREFLYKAARNKHYSSHYCFATSVNDKGRAGKILFITKELVKYVPLLSRTR